MLQRLLRLPCLLCHAAAVQSTFCSSNRNRAARSQRSPLSRPSSLRHCPPPAPPRQQPALGSTSSTFRDDW